MTFSQSTLLIFGLGYSARAVLRQPEMSDWLIYATARDEAQASTNAALGVKPVLLSERAEELPKGPHLLITAAPDETGCPAFKALHTSEFAPASVTYLSTTGVYGDLNGGWAFEWSPANPQSVRAQRRVDAENTWSAWADERSIPFRTVRLPGIYGPGRSPFDRIRKGRARRIIKPGQVFSRVHVDDLASGVARLLNAPDQAGVYHLCDDVPAPPQDVIEYAANLLGVAIPPDEDITQADLSAMAKSFYSECKRVSNARTKSALSWRPKYASYAEGLSAILETERRSS